MSASVSSGSEGIDSHLQQRAQALGLGGDWLKQLLQRAGPLAVRIIISLLEHYQPQGQVVGQTDSSLAEPTTVQDHARYCDRCLEHLVAAMAICVQQRQRCEAEKQ